MLLDVPAMPVAIKFSNCLLSVAVLSLSHNGNVSQTGDWPAWGGWVREVERSCGVSGAGERKGW